MNRPYTYNNCDTCRRAVKFLTSNAVSHEIIPIRESPPTLVELRAALDSCGGDLRRLFNTSGGDYRSLNLKDKLPLLSQSEALELLTTNGNLVKRPLLIAPETILVGFEAPAWEAALETGELKA